MFLNIQNDIADFSSKEPKFFKPCCCECIIRKAVLIIQFYTIGAVAPQIWTYILGVEGQDFPAAKSSVSK